MGPAGALVYSTYLPGEEQSRIAFPRAIAVDGLGNAYITGEANAQEFPTTVTTLPAKSDDDVFVLKLSADGSELLFSALFGGKGKDYGSAIGVGHDGTIYVAGASHTTTGSGPDLPFPTTPGVLDNEPGFPRGFLTRLAASGDALLFSTFLPETREAECLSIDDTGVDLLLESPYRLMRVSLDGKALHHDSLVSSAGHCGLRPEALALATGSRGKSVLSPDLNPIGPTDGDDVWFSMATPSSTESSRLELDVGEIRLSSWMSADGSFSPVLQVIHATAGDHSGPLAVFSGDAVDATPSRTTTPAEITVSASAGRYSDHLLFFAPGVRNALHVLPVSMGVEYIYFRISPLDPVRNAVNFAAPDPETPPITQTILISSEVSATTSGTVPAPIPFTLGPVSGRLPDWLTIDKTEGTTPTEVRLTVDPSRASPGFQSQRLQLRGPEHDFQSPEKDFRVRFQVGPPPEPQPRVVTDPSEVHFLLNEDRPVDSETVHLDSTGDPITFAIDSPPEWLTIEPASGTTPTDVTVTASLPVATVPDTTPYMAIRDPDGDSVGGIRVAADFFPPGFLASLDALPVSTLPVGSDHGDPFVAPGGFFHIRTRRPVPVPSEPLEGDPAALPTSLGGYSFKLDGEPVPLLSYESRSYLAQVPTELGIGTFTLDAFDPEGRHVATSGVKVGAVVPSFLGLVSGRWRAYKANGSTIGPNNPIQPGDPILVHLTSQGPVDPPIPTGHAATPGQPSTPELPLTATLGGKEARVLSAQMSETEAGILDVWLEAPRLYDGFHRVAVKIGRYVAEGPSVSVRTALHAPRIDPSSIVNAASYSPVVAPGSLFTVFGTGLAPFASDEDAVATPVQTSVTIGGHSAPLVYVSPTQINGQVPYEVTPSEATAVVVTVGETPSPPKHVSVAPTAPGLFQFGLNRAVVQNQDYSVNDESNGATPGSYVTVYLTGGGRVDNPVATGSVAQSSPLSRALGHTVATVNGVPANVQFAGLTPGFIGLVQVNLEVPILAPGTYPLMISIDGQWSNSALITVE